MVLSADEQKRLVKLAQQGCKTSLKKLIECNTPFYKKLAKKYAKGMHNDFEEDLFQVGLDGLVHNILPKYDEEKGANWLTFSSAGVAQYMRNYKVRHYCTVSGVTNGRNGRCLFYLARKVGDASELLKEMNKRGYNVTKKYIEEFLAATSTRYGTPVEKQDFINQRYSEEGIIRDPFLTKRVKKALEKAALSDREKIILENLITEKYTFTELGEQFKCSRQRVHQLEERLKEKLRKALVI